MKAYKNFFYLVVIFFLASCGGGGSSSTPDQQEEPNQFPSHPYTEVLLGAVLEPDPDIKPKLVAEDIVEEKPPKKGCSFQGRCSRIVGEISVSCGDGKISPVNLHSMPDSIKTHPLAC